MKENKLEPLGVHEQKILYNYLLRKNQQSIIHHPNNTINTLLKIDFICLCLFCTYQQLRVLLYFLKQLSVNGCKRRLLKGDIFTESRTYNIMYNNDVHKVVILYSPKGIHKAYFIVHDPDRTLLHFVDKLVSVVAHYKVSMVEYVIDFYGAYPDRIFRFLKRTALLRWRGKTFDYDYDTAQYLGDPRNSKSKGGRIYIKEEDDQKFVRQELVVKRGILRRRNIFTIDELLEIESDIVSLFFSYKRFDYDKLITRLMDEKCNPSEVFKIIDVVRTWVEKGKLYDVNKLIEGYLGNCFTITIPFKDELINGLNSSSFFNQDYFPVEAKLMDNDLVFSFD